LDFSPEGGRIAVGDWAGQVAIWDVNHHSPVATWTDSNHVDTVSFSHKGNLLAIGDSQGLVTVWDMASNSQVTVDVGTSVNSLAFGARDRTLIVDYGPVVAYPTSMWTSSFDALKTGLCRTLNGVALTKAQFTQYVPDSSYSKACP
jgi:WD40 repeat protein